MENNKQLLRSACALSRWTDRLVVLLELTARALRRTLGIPVMTPAKAPSRRITRVASVALLAACICNVGRLGFAQATTAGFDDILPSSTTYGVVPNNYEGLNWSGFDYIYQNYLPGSGYQVGTHSPNFAAYNVFGQGASVSSGSAFSFGSAYLTSAWIPGLKLTITGFNGVTQVGTQTLTLSNTTPLLYTPDSRFADVTSLQFSTSYSSGDGSNNPAGTQFVMDDFKFGPPNFFPVPEPSSVILLTAGGAGLLLWRRRAKAGR